MRSSRGRSRLIVFIKKVRVLGFGKLHGSYTFEPGRCNVICQENEFGKSTLVDAMLFTLYRFPIAHGDGTTRAADRYRPWASAPGAQPYRVEMEVTGLNGRDYLIGCDFADRQTFEVYDLNTGHAIPLTDSSFGKQLLGMPLHVFTQCFFLRQDERTAVSHDDLVDLVEAAAAGSHRVQQIPANAALDKLESAHIAAPGLDSEHMAPSAIVTAADRRIADCEAALVAMRDEQQHLHPRIEETEKLAAEAGQLKSLQTEVEQALALAELREIEEMLQWHAARQAGLARQAELSELLQRYDPHLKAKAEATWERMVQLSAEGKEKQRKLDEEVVEGLRRLRERQPDIEDATAVSVEQLARFRSLRSLLHDRRSEIARQRQQLDEMRAKLTGEGLTAESYTQMRQLCEHLPAADTRMLLEYDSRSAELEGALAEAQKRQSDSGARVSAARSGRQKLRAKATSFLMGAVAATAIGVLFFIMKPVWRGAAPAGVLALVAGAVSLAFGILQVRRTQAYSGAELEPALAGEIKTSSETRRLAEQLDNLRHAFKETVQRLHLGWDDTQFIRRVGRWSEVLVPYQAAEQYLARLEKGYADALEDLRRDLSTAGVETETAALEHDGVIDEAIGKLEMGTAWSGQRDDLDREGAGLMARIEEIDAETRECELTLTEILGCQADGMAALEARVKDYLAGCDRAAALESASAGGPASLPPPEELRQRAENLRVRIQEDWPTGTIPASEFSGLSRSYLEQRLREIQARREEIRSLREAAFHECDAVITRWRTEALRLHGEVGRLKALREQAAAMHRALEMAQEMMRDAVATTVVNWTSALNEKVNDILPQITPSYRDVVFGNDLSVSLYSMEHGRRLNGGETVALSKGARDQVNLAIRVAISEFISSHVGFVPIVLDEPFAHWDDSRFVEGMRFLDVLAKRHQVLLLSCHGWRYEELEKRVPELAADLRFVQMQRVDGETPPVVSKSLQ
jgi:hypothetical protein